ncbi:MAG TPA: ATP-dependent DNA helicase RecG, partial [Magnetospirillaceae bacterium]|nr:ATP-dependent DNA helicase RecG [Magnetospirillaceae bacterium]
MFLRELTQKVSSLRGAGPAVAARLARLGILGVADLLLQVPRDYEDRSRATPFREAARVGGIANTVGVVSAHDWFGYGRSRTLKILVDDGTATAALVCFNRSFLADRHPVGSHVRVTGTVQLRFQELQSTNFEVEASAEGRGPEAGILPVYALTDGLAQGTMRRLTSRALAEYGRRVEDELPAGVLARRAIPPKAAALAGLHAPASLEDADRALRALAFEELFYLQILVRSRARSRARAERPAPGIPRPEQVALGDRLRERLPFRLTQDQAQVISEIEADMKRPRPMARLLQGDVGSGKTLVAFLAALQAIEYGGQAALMAPTELLARQHAQTAARLLEPLGVRLAFLTGNLKDASRRPLLTALAAGEVDFVLGTHALFSEDVEYRRLALAIVDEQHRFGVLQRLALSRKGETPDLLLMTATPIPRTLALTVYGDLDISTLRTMPPGRRPVVTHLARHGNEAKVYAFVRRELEAGRQAYFVYPLIQEGEASAL